MFLGRRLLPAVFATAILGASAWASPARSEAAGSKVEPAASRVLTNTRRWLRATSWGDAFQNGMRSFVSSEGKTNPLLERVLQAKPVELETLVAPLFAKRLSEPEARALADFYESPAARHITKQQLARLGDPDPPISLTAEERQEYERFASGVGGRAAKRILSDTGVRKEYLHALQDHFGR
jgi:hypothetical protein